MRITIDDLTPEEVESIEEFLTREGYWYETEEQGDY